MKKRTRTHALATPASLVLVSLLVLTMVTLSDAAVPPAVDLGTAGSYGVLGGSTVTNAGPTTITGNLGVSPGTAITDLGQITVHGAVHQTDAAAAQAQADLQTAYDQAAGKAPDKTATVPADIGGLTLSPGVYRYDSSLAITGAVILDGKSNPDATFIFQIGSTLTTASAASVVLINGAQACNVFWQVGSSATLGTTTSFQGTIMSLASTTLATNATVTGSVLARTAGAVTLDTNVVTLAPCSVTASPSPSPRPSASASPSPSPTSTDTGGSMAPTVTGVTPGSGDAGGGTTVTITGQGLTGATAVIFGSTPGTGLTVINDHALTVTTPAGTGTVEITVKTPTGTSPQTPTSIFTYTTPRLPVTGFHTLLFGLLGLGLIVGGLALTRASRRAYQPRFRQQ